MEPIGPLMSEHRLIERMVELVSEELVKLNEGINIDPHFIDVAIYFFRTYADRTHHGKEEDILFKDLTRKQLSPEHKETMDELNEEHIVARKTVANLVGAKERYVAGDSGAFQHIVDSMKQLVNLYPMHIEKEDKTFFYPCMEYFSKQEKDSMLQEFWEFD